MDKYERMLARMQKLCSRIEEELRIFLEAAEKSREQRREIALIFQFGEEYHRQEEGEDRIIG